MPDDVRITQSANSTPPDGTIIATDAVGGKHYQRFKLDVGGDGVSLPLLSGDKGEVICETHIEHEIHQGHVYYLSGFITITSGSTHYVKLVTPNTTGSWHLGWEIESGGILETNLWEGSTGGMTGGAGMTPLNSNRNSTGSSALTITGGVTVATSKGTKVDSTKVGGTGFKSVTGGKADRSDRILLKQDETYFREFISSSDANIISFRAAWIEST